MEIKTQETLFKYLKENLKENSDPNIFFKSLTNKIFNVNIELVFSPLKQVDSLYFILIAIINLEADKRQKIVKKYDGNDLLNILMIDLLSPELEYDLKLLAMSLISLKIVYVLYFSNIPEITFPGKTDFTLGNFSKLTDLLKIKLNEPSKKFADLLISKGFIPEKTLKHLNSCLNLDGGYGSNPGRESHCGYIYAALCSYKLLIQFIDSKTIQESINLPRLLSFYKLLDAGPGIRGRINKEPDLCYNFWVGASLQILNSIFSTKIQLDDLFKSLNMFSKQCKKSGYSASPDAQEDIFHTMYFMLGELVCDSKCDPIFLLI